MTPLRVVALLVVVVGLARLVEVGRTWASAPPRATAGGDCRPADQGFRELLQTVQAQSRDLVQRDADLRAREKGLESMRKAVATEIARLEGVARTLGITGAGTTGVAVTKVFESMRPEDAAPILDRLDDTTLRVLLGRMRERQLGALLAAMAPERAVVVTKALATGAVRPADPASVPR